MITGPDITSSSTSTSASSANASDDPAAANSSAEQSYGWFQRKGEPETATAVYARLEDGLSVIAEALRTEGPFDGVVGFSQGGFMAGIVASLLEVGRRDAFDALEAQGIGMAFPRCFLEGEGEGEEERDGAGKEEGNGESGMEGGRGRKDKPVHPPLKFAVSYSGFGATPNPLYKAFYAPAISTPIMHFIGTMDTVVEESRSMRLVDATEAGRDSEVGKRRIVRHPGGHFLPASQRQCFVPLVGFVRECMASDWGEADAPTGKRDKEEAEMPF